MILKMRCHTKVLKVCPVDDNDDFLTACGLKNIDANMAEPNLLKVAVVRLPAQMFVYYNSKLFGVTVYRNIGGRVYTNIY